MLTFAFASTVALAAPAHPRKKSVRPVISNVVHVVVSRGQPIQIALANDPGSGTRITNAVQMAVDHHATVRGFPIQINIINAPTCGDPPTAASFAVATAHLVISDLETASTVDARGNLIVNRAAFARAVRNTAGYPGVSCAITLDPTTGNRLDDPAALSNCALG